MILEAPARAENDIPPSGIMVVTTKGHGSHMAYAWAVLRAFCQCPHHCTSTHAPALASRRASSKGFKHHHVRIFSGTHKQKFGSPYIKPTPPGAEESPRGSSLTLYLPKSVGGPRWPPRRPWKPPMRQEDTIENRHPRPNRSGLLLWPHNFGRDDAAPSADGHGGVGYSSAGQVRQRLYPLPETSI